MLNRERRSRLTMQPYIGLVEYPIITQRAYVEPSIHMKSLYYQSYVWWRSVLIKVIYLNIPTLQTKHTVIYTYVYHVSAFKLKIQRYDVWSISACPNCEHVMISWQLLPLKTQANTHSFTLIPPDLILSIHTPGRWPTTNHRLNVGLLNPYHTESSDSVHTSDIDWMSPPDYNLWPERSAWTASLLCFISAD